MEDLENYEPKEDLKGFPKEIITRMLQCQEEQRNEKDVTVFERKITSKHRGFDWHNTKEKFWFWDEVIYKRNFDLFFEKYPKKEDNQEFRVEDKVYDIILGKVGIVKQINIDDISVSRIEVVFENYGIAFYTIDYTIEGKLSSIDKYPKLLHYRDDYDYSIIDFNNLPKRQESKRRRVKKGELYYIIYLEGMGFGRGANLDKYNEDDNEYYEYGNYFKTDEEAEEIAEKMNSYFKQLIKEEHERI